MTTTLENKELPIFDIYVLSEGGIPVFAGCSTSDYCAEHEGQHPLHTGFIHAIQNFGSEVFSSTINNLKFDTVKLNFKSVGPYTIVFVNPLETSDEFIKEKLDEVGELLHHKYADKIESHNLAANLYEEFIDDIVSMGLIARDRIKSTRNIFVSDDQTENKPTNTNGTIFSRFKKKFEHFIRR